jgi:hypothetical protein
LPVHDGPPNIGWARIIAKANIKKKPFGLLNASSILNFLLNANKKNGSNTIKGNKKKVIRSKRFISLIVYFKSPNTASEGISSRPALFK